jgi:hypothetical protein
MNPYEHSRPFRSPSFQRPQHNSLPPRPRTQEDTIKTHEFQIERKTFVFLLRENPRGRFLRIIEEGGKNPTASSFHPLA